MAPKYKKDGLPRCVYLKHSQYWYVKGGKWHALGKTKAEMYKNLSKVSIDSPNRSTMAELINRYIKEVCQGQTSGHQKEMYLKDWALIIGHMTPDKVRPRDIAKVHDAMGKRAPVKANRSLQVIRHVFTKAKRWGYIDGENPASIERHTEKPRDRFVTIDEYLDVYMRASPSMQVAMELSRITGLRQGDVLRLQWFQVTEDGIYSQASKNGRKLFFKMNDSLAVTIKDARSAPDAGRSSYIIQSRKGGRYTSNGFQSVWRRLEAGFTFHDIRAMAASMRESDKSAAELLGNTEAATRKHYRRGFKVVEPNN